MDTRYGNGVANEFPRVTLAARYICTGDSPSWSPTGLCACPGYYPRGGSPRAIIYYRGIFIAESPNRRAEERLAIAE